MHFGEPVEDDRLVALLRPDERITTVITSDVYGQGGADEMVGRALLGVPRESYQLVGMVGHDFYEGERAGAKGYPRFTDPSLRSAGDYAEYLQMATERSLERCGVDQFDVLMLHNPDRIGYTSPQVWDAMAELRESGLTRAIGVAPGPANGFTLDVIDCLERFGERIDWAMLILNPLEPWPGSLALPACVRHHVQVIARVVDYGGLFHDDLQSEDDLGERDHRAFRPSGWVDRGRDEARPAAPDRRGPRSDAAAAGVHLDAGAAGGGHGRADVDSGAGRRRPPDRGPAGRAGGDARRAACSAARSWPLIAEIGDNTGSMALKGGSPSFEGAERPDAWPLSDDLRQTADRWGLDPERDLALRAPVGSEYGARHQLFTSLRRCLGMTSPPVTALNLR